jgi:sorbitol-specific phosphotransferase system component IIA
MSLSNRQIIRLMDKKKMNRDELLAIIEEKHPKGISSICNLNKNRFDEIFKGDDLTFIEAMLIVEALGYSISKMFI